MEVYIPYYFFIRSLFLLRLSSCLEGHRLISGQVSAVINLIQHDGLDHSFAARGDMSVLDFLIRSLAFWLQFTSVSVNIFMDSLGEDE